MDDFGSPFVRFPGYRSSSPDAVGAHFSPNAPWLGLAEAPHGALLKDLGVDGVRESVRLRGKRRPGSAGASGPRAQRG